MLIARLQQIAMGDANNGEPHHVTAALGLLKKVCPDLSATEMTGKDRGPMVFVFENVDA